MEIKKFVILLTTLILTACDEEASSLEGDESVDFREIAACPTNMAPYNQIPADDAAMKTLFGKTMLITAPWVVDDPCRTNYNPTLWQQKACAPATQGRWSFWYLASQMAGNNGLDDTALSGFILNLLESMEKAGQQINGFPLESRKLIRTLVINPWRQKSGCNTVGDPLWETDHCKLKPEYAPVRLLALVNRIDARPDTNQAIPSYYTSMPDAGQTVGEGRFVFGFTDPVAVNMDGTAKPIEAHIIFEYALPTAVKNRIVWANDWLNLNVATDTVLQQEAYRVKLTAITEAFATKNKFPGRPNSASALNHVRTNEFAFDATNPKEWSMRQFSLACPNNLCDPNSLPLTPGAVDLTPDNSLNDDPTLVQWINDHNASIMALAHVLPANFTGGESRSRKFNQSFQWMFDSYENDLIFPANVAADVRRLFAISTCNGCHYYETGTNLADNQHIHNRSVGYASALSPFLTSYVKVDGVPTSSGNAYVEFNEPRRRLCELYHTKTGASKPLSKFSGHSN